MFTAEIFKLGVEKYLYNGQTLLVGPELSPTVTSKLETSYYSGNPCCYVGEGLFQEYNHRAVIRLMQHSPIQAVKEVRDRFGWSLHKAKLLVDVIRTLVEPENFELEIHPESITPLQYQPGPKIGILLGCKFQVPVYCVLEDKKGKRDLNKIFGFCQSHEVPWWTQESEDFRIISMSGIGAPSMSVGDTIFIYNDNIPLPMRTYLVTSSGFELQPSPSA